MVEFNENVSCGEAPDEAGIKHLSQRGFKTVVDLRTDEELSGCKAPRLSQSAGLRYIHLPVTGDGLSENKLSRFYRTVFDEDKYPVYVYGQKGIRPVALLLTISALKEGKSVVEILEDAKELNTPAEHAPELVRFVEAFFHRRKGHHEHEGIATEVIERWLRPRNRGVIPGANGLGKVTGPCGDTIEIYLRIRNDRIEQAGYLTNGCPNSAACASMGAELAQGKSLSEAYDLTHEDIVSSFSDLPKDEQHCAKLTIVTLRQAIDGYFRTEKRKRPDDALSSNRRA